MERKYRHFDILVTGCTGSCLMTTPGATNDEKLVKMTFFQFQWTLTIQYTTDANPYQYSTMLYFDVETKEFWALLCLKILHLQAVNNVN